MLELANLLGAVLTVSAPEGGAVWLYLLVSCTACAGAMAFNVRKQLRKTRAN